MSTGKEALDLILRSIRVKQVRRGRGGVRGGVWHAIGSK